MTSAAKDRAVAHAAVPSSLPWSEPELARLILAGTGVVAFLMVLLWLIGAARVFPPRQTNVLEIWLPHPEGIIGNKPSTKDDVVNTLTTFFDRANAGPVVVILHGVVASRASDAVGDQDAYFLTPGGSRGSLPTWIPLVDILKPFTARGRRESTFLVLDCEVKAGDRNLGLFGNGFVRGLKRLLSESRTMSDKLAVLAACDDAQSTWSMEGTNRSAFDHFVKEVLDEALESPGLISVNELHRRVRARVAGWVDSHRSKAVQTPLLFAARDMPIHLIRQRGAGASTRFGVSGQSPPDEQESQDGEATLEDELKTEWGERQRLSTATPPPYRHAPVKWRLYQDALLRAERRLRAGDLPSARVILNEAKDYRNDVEKQRTGPNTVPAWSLAMLRKNAGSHSGSAASEAVKYLEAIDRLLQPKNGQIGFPGSARTDGAAAARSEPAKDSKQAEPVTATITPFTMTGDDPVAILAEKGNPRYVEGQLPVWYHEFVHKGGEIGELRPDRLVRLGRAIDIRKKAEEIVALDPRIIPWVRPLVNEGDKARRAGQDYLFGGNLESLKKCDEKLAEAERIYERVESRARPWSQAFDLIGRVQDALPYYGTWAALRGESVPLPEEACEHAATMAAVLADLVRQHSVPEAEIEERSKTLLAAAESLEKKYLKRLEEDFQKQLQDSGAAEWRQIDALLYVPWILPDTRTKLLGRARKLSAPSDDREGIASLEPANGLNPDPAFSRLARALAKMEQGLLKIAGRDVSQLGESLDIGFADRVRRLRDQPAGEANAPGNPQIQSHDRTLAEAERFVRVATGVDLLRLTSTDDPARGLDLLDTQRFLRWNAERLLDDFDIAATRRLLSGPGLFRGDDRDVIEQRAHLLEASTVEIDANPENAGLTPTSVTLKSSEHFPKEGLIAVFFAHEPAPDVAVPSQIAEPSRPGRLEFPLCNFGKTAVNLTPTAFFRGRFFEDNRFALPVTELVKVAIHQAWTSARPKIDDQFKKEPHKGFFHVGKNLAYKLEITNISQEVLRANVSGEFAGAIDFEKKKLGLPPGAAEWIDGEVRGIDFADKKPRALTVSVDDEQGRPLCAPYTVVFTPVDATRFVKVNPTFDGDEYKFKITHQMIDPSPFPVDVKLGMLPHGHFKLLNNLKDSYRLFRGDSITLTYVMVKDTEKVGYSLQVNSEAVKSETSQATEKKEESKTGDADKNAKPPGPPDQ